MHPPVRPRNVHTPLPMLYNAGIMDVLVRERTTRETDETVYMRRLEGALAPEGVPFRLVDLFAGAGGLTLGFSSRMGHSFEPVWANDYNAESVATYNANFGAHCTLGDISSILADRDFDVPKADLVIGGPPCQGFSLLNRNRNNDARKEMWRPFMDVVERSEASVFVIENVPQILGTPEHDAIIATARSMGFECVYEKLCAADYGVPQARWRAFIIGCKHGDSSRVFPPKRTHFNPRALTATAALLDSRYVDAPQSWRTVRDAIEDLPPPRGVDVRDEPPPFDLHFGRNPTPKSRARYRIIPEEGMNRFDLHRLAPELTPACWIRKVSGGTDLFGRLWWDRPAFTIRTEFYKPEKGRYLHPEQHRPITHREAARLQSFPDDFVFRGSKVEIAKQIGNAVPPMLAARVADCVYTILYEMLCNGVRFASH